MPAPVAALLCTLLILYLFWVDLRTNKEVSGGIWIPLIWMFLAGSRYLSAWLSLGLPIDKSVDPLEGSALDRTIFMVLIAAGLFILRRRQVAWGRLLSNNRWIWLFFLWGAISVLWSDDPFVSFKRVIKASGNAVMALVVLTEKRPYEAAGILLGRLAFICVPLSVLFVKYYPELGRTYNPWTDEPMFMGIANQKNGLGQICLLGGIYFSWALFRGREVSQKLPFYVPVLLLCMIAWLLSVADSATSLISLTMVVALLLASRMPLIRREPRRLMVLGLTAACLIGMLEMIFNVSATVLALVGRDPTLTTRVPMWQELLRIAPNPLTGVGFESFWVADRVSGIWERYGRLMQAHNGYLELYLSVGLVGLGLVLVSIMSGLVNVHQHLKTEHAAGILRLCFVLAAVVYNWTEATFVSVSNIWLVFFLGVMKVPAREAAAVMQPIAAADRSAGALAHGYSFRGHHATFLANRFQDQSDKGPVEGHRHGAGARPTPRMGIHKS
jgi:exopolysaccharide production protein ExoQ